MLATYVLPCAVEDKAVEKNKHNHSKWIEIESANNFCALRNPFSWIHMEYATLATNWDCRVINEFRTIKNN